MISTVSFLVGCGGIEEDPDAAANEAQEPTEKDADNSDLSDGEKKKMDDAINPPDWFHREKVAQTRHNSWVASDLRLNRFRIRLPSTDAMAGR